MVETQQAFQCSKVVQKDPIASQMVNLPVFDHAESFWANFVGHFGQKMILPTKNKVFLIENLFCSKMVWNDPKWSKTVRLIACHIGNSSNFTNHYWKAGLFQLEQRVHVHVHVDEEQTAFQMRCLWLPLNLEYLDGSIFWKWRRYFHFMRSNCPFLCLCGKTESILGKS